MANADETAHTRKTIVPTVVAHMMTPGVVQVPGDVSVSEAALLLEREQAPCLLIKDTDARFGLMTPTDIVKKVVAQGLEPHEIEVRTIMSRPVQFIEYDQALEDASSLMTATGAPLLIVTKQNQPVGVLSAQDLMLTPPRRGTTIPVVVSAMGAMPGQGSNHNATITQLSHVGALIESNATLHAKTKVVLAFSLPGQNTPLTIRGIVLTSRSSAHISQIDVQFTDLSSADLARIKAWALQTIPSPTDRF